MPGTLEQLEQLQILAGAIDKRGLSGPVIMLLVATRPFRYVLNQMMVMAAPLLGWSSELGTSRFSWLLEDKEQFEHLILLLEHPSKVVHDEGGE
jgi:hypothetical protein